MNFTDSFRHRLERRLRGPLPGVASRCEYAPELSYGRHDGPPQWNARRAAVLVLLYSHHEAWHLPLTHRPDTMSTHSGQVSLPGGEIEPGETPETAALRELHEELGVQLTQTDILGRLSQIYVYASNYLVTPCVALTDARPSFVPNPDEVANLLEPSLVDLFDVERYRTRRIQRRGVIFRAPEIVVEGSSVWGATRLVLAEFCDVLREVG